MQSLGNQNVICHGRNVRFILVLPTYVLDCSLVIQSIHVLNFLPLRFLAIFSETVWN